MADERMESEYCCCNTAHKKGIKCPIHEQKIDTLQNILEWFAETWLAISGSTDDVEIIERDTEKLIDQALTQIKEELLGKLPTEMKWSIGYQHQDCVDAEQRGFNSCLSQIKQVIKEA